MSAYLNGNPINYIPWSLKVSDIVRMPVGTIDQRTYGRKLRALGFAVRVRACRYIGYYEVYTPKPKGWVDPNAPPKRKWVRKDPAVVAMRARRAERRAWHREHAAAI
jgi:hypothetical protein